MTKKINKNNNRAFTIIEVVVVPAILLMVVLAIMNAFTAYIKTSKGSLDTVKASYLLDEGVEVMKTFRDKSWNQYVAGIPINTPFRISWSPSLDFFATTSTITLIDNQFDQTIVLDNVYRDASTKDISTIGVLDPNTKKITVSVAWKGETGTTTKTVSAYITNLFNN